MVEDLAPLEKICNFEGFCLGNVHILLDICCQHLGIYVSWRVSVRPSGAGLGKDKFQTRQVPPGQVPGGDKFLGGQIPGGTSTPRTKSWGDKYPKGQVPWPGSCPGGSYPGGTCLLAAKIS